MRRDSEERCWECDRAAFPTPKQVPDRWECDDCGQAYTTARTIDGETVWEYAEDEGDRW